METHYLACDLGAESGRLIRGALRDGVLQLDEVHRFPNTPVAEAGSLLWNIPQLFNELRTGMQRAATVGVEFSSISTDSWGVDYILFTAEGDLLAPTFHYRDGRSEHGVKTAYSKVKWEEVFAETGIQFMPINTLFQLAAEPPERLAEAEVLLGIGDGFNYLLSGKPWAEVSLASTSQLYNPRTRTWSDRLIDALGFPRRLFPPVVPSGTRLGPIRDSLVQQWGIPQIDVVASCSHDTGAAVAGVPAAGEDWAFLSSGTWSLMGIELPGPIVTDPCRAFNFTNEIGYGNSVRLLKNIVGLWIVQECRRAWALEGVDYDYARLTEMASASPAFVSLINPTDARFLSPGDMPEKVAAYCRETGQPAPSERGAVVRCVLESLALQYRRTLDQIEQLTGRKLQRLHIVGGGGKNRLLNQLAANAVGIPVTAGPDEATAAGNMLIQAISHGHVHSLAEAREIVGRSFSLATYEPQDRNVWLEAYDRFSRLG